MDYVRKIISIRIMMPCALRCDLEITESLPSTGGWLGHSRSAGPARGWVAVPGSVTPRARHHGTESLQRVRKNTNEPYSLVYSLPRHQQWQLESDAQGPRAGCPNCPANAMMIVQVFSLDPGSHESSNHDLWLILLAYVLHK